MSSLMGGPVPANSSTPANLAWLCTWMLTDADLVVRFTEWFNTKQAAAAQDDPYRQARPPASVFDVAERMHDMAQEMLTLAESITTTRNTQN